MCLTINREEFKIVKATKDIIVYKLLHIENIAATEDTPAREIIKPLFMTNSGTEYKLNERNTEVVLHPRVCGNGDIISFNEGYYSIKSLRTADQYIMDRVEDRGSLFQCVIPKGSFYCKDRHGWIISSNIIIKRHLTRYFVSTNSTNKRYWRCFKSAEQAEAEYERLCKYYTKDSSDWVHKDFNGDNYKSRLFALPPRTAIFVWIKWL